MKKRIRSLFWILSAPFRFIFWLLRSLFTAVLSIGQRTYRFLTFEPQESDLPEMVQQVVQSPNVLFPHINALRRHIFRALLFLTITTMLSFTFAQRILDFLAKPLNGGTASLIVIEVTEPISVFMRISLLTGFALALPYIIFELVLFIGEGLSKKTRLYLLFFIIPTSTLLFIGGMAFAYFIMLPVAIPFLLNLLSFQTTVRASSYIKFVSGVMFWLGIIFEFPMLIFILARISWVRAAMLLKQWRIAIIIIAIIAALVTPTVDPVNMAIVMVPMILLYFLSIGLAWIAQPKQA